MSEVVATAQQELASKYKPYPEYKDSGVEWLGEMPSTWILAKTARYFKIAMGQTILKEQLEDDGEWPVYSATEGDHYFGRVNNPLVRLGCGDLVIPARGNSIGFVKLVKEHVTTTQTTIYCKHLTQKIYPEYAYYFMVGQKKNLFWFTQTAIPQITVEEIGSNPILLPSSEEQRTIATFLDYETAQIDRLITQQQRLIELLKEKRQAVISHAVTKGLNPETPMKDSGVEWLGQVPEHWNTHALKFAASNCKKSFTDGDWIETPYISDEGIRLLQTGNIGIGSFKEQGFRYISESSFKTLKCTEVKPNDVLICRLDGPVGRSCLAPHLDVKMITSVDNAILKPSDDFDAEFLVYLTNSVGWLEWIQDICRVGGGFRLRISRTMLGEQIIPVPPIDEQKAIAKELNLLSEYTDLCVQKCTEAIALLVERRSALISAAVTGKIDLRGWTPPADEVAA